MNDVNARVVILSPFFPPDKGGVESFLAAVCSELDQKIPDYRVITFFPLKEAKLGLGDVDDRIVRVPWFGKGVFDKINHNSGLVFFYLAIPYVFAATILCLGLDRSKRDLIFLGNGLIGSIVAVIVGKILAKGKAVAVYHAVYEKISPIIRKAFIFVWSRSDKILACSNAVKNQIVSVYPAAAAKTDVFYYWIDREIFNVCGKSQQSTSILVPRIGFIGRLIPEKGVQVMEAICRICRVKVTVCGTGPMERHCLESAERNQDYIFAGKLERRDLALTLSELDFLVIPSFYAEAGPIVLIECLAFEVIPIITSCSGYADVLRNTVLERFIVDPSEEAVVSCVQNLVFAPQDQLQVWKRECLNVYRRYFTPEVAAPHFFDKAGIKNAF